MNGWPYEADSGEQLLQERHWQAEEDRINMERLQDRLDRYVASFAASMDCRGLGYKELVSLALEAIKAVDDAAKREVLGHEDV